MALAMSTESKLASDIRVDVQLWGVAFAMYTAEGAQRVPPSAVTLDIGMLERASIAPPRVEAPPGSVPEAIYWRHPENDRPDCDITVMVHTPLASEPVHLGYWDGEHWCSADELTVWSEGEVKAWADVPAGRAVP